MKRRIYIGEPSKKIQDRIEEFRQEVKSYSATYPLDLLEEFFIYWAEPDKTNRRFRKELQKTWDTNLRIHTWARRSKTYNNNGRSNKRSGVTGADIDAMVDAIFGEDAD